MPPKFPLPHKYSWLSSAAIRNAVLPGQTLSLYIQLKFSQLPIVTITDSSCLPATPLLRGYMYSAGTIGDKMDTQNVLTPGPHFCMTMG